MKSDFRTFTQTGGISDLFPQLPRADGKEWTAQIINDEVKRLAGQEIDISQNQFTLPAFRKIFDEESISRDQYIVKRIAGAAKEK